MHASSSSSNCSRDSASLFASSTRAATARRNSAAAFRPTSNIYLRRQKRTSRGYDRNASTTTTIRCHQKTSYETVNLGKTQHGIAFTDLNNMCNEMIAKNGIIETLLIDNPGDIELSTAESLLSTIGP